VLVAAGLILFGSIVYYIIVFCTEIAGKVPNVLKILCATKQSRHEKQAAMLSMHRMENHGDDGDIEMFTNPTGAGAGMDDNLDGATKRNQDKQKKRKDLGRWRRVAKGGEGWRRVAKGVGVCGDGVCGDEVCGNGVCGEPGTHVLFCGALVASSSFFLPLLVANELENLNETQGALNADYRKLKAQAARDQFEGQKPKHRKGRSKQKKRVFDPRHVNDFGHGDETPVELTTTKKESLG
jgi:hypothetical protein